MADLNEMFCGTSPNLIHAFSTDKEDKRFKVCLFCNISRYRTDEELLEEHRRKEKNK